MILSVVAAAALLSQPAEALVKPRDMAPEWRNVNAVVGEEFAQVSSSDYAGKYLVMIFYPFDFTYVCPTELIAYSEAVPRFTELNASIVGVSTDSHHTHLAWVKTPRTEGGIGRIEYPLLADFSKEISREYGVLVEDAKDGMFGAALRGIFIIDDRGKVRSMQINDDSVGRSVDETLRLINGFQFADKHGQVCPANWKPGDATITPDQEKKQKFFQEAYSKADL